MTNQQFIKKYEKLRKTNNKRREKLEGMENKTAMLESLIAGTEIQLEAMEVKYQEIKENEGVLAEYDPQSAPAQNTISKIKSKVSLVVDSLLN